MPRVADDERAGRGPQPQAMMSAGAFNHRVRGGRRAGTKRLAERELDEVAVRSFSSRSNSPPGKAPRAAPRQGNRRREPWRCGRRRRAGAGEAEMPVLVLGWRLAVTARQQDKDEFAFSAFLGQPNHRRAVTGAALMDDRAQSADRSGCWRRYRGRAVLCASASAVPEALCMGCYPESLSRASALGRESSRIGSTACLPLRTSKCSCGRSTLPDEPTRAMTWPGAPASPR